MILGPNIRYACKEYWHYYDHYLALSHLSLVEGLTLAGYRPEKPSSIVSYLYDEQRDTHRGLDDPFICGFHWRGSCSENNSSSSRKNEMLRAMRNVNLDML